MDRKTELELMRLLHGELPRARRAALEARLAHEPELRAALARLEAGWRSLELPEPEAAPPGFAAAVADRTLAEGRAGTAASGRPDAGWSPPSWALLPLPARLAAAAALAAGVALGSLAGGDLTGALDEPEEAEILAGVSTLAESYWLAAGDPGLDLDQPGRREVLGDSDRPVPR